MQGSVVQIQWAVLMSVAKSPPKVMKMSAVWDATGRHVDVLSGALNQSQPLLLLAEAWADKLSYHPGPDPGL